MYVPTGCTRGVSSPAVGATVNPCMRACVSPEFCAVSVSSFAGCGGGPRDRRAGRAFFRDKDRDAEAQCDLEPREIGVGGLRHFLQDQPIAQLARRVRRRAAKRNAHQLRALRWQGEHRRRHDQVACRREPLLAVDLLPEHDFRLNQGFPLVIAHGQRGRSGRRRQVEADR